MPDLPDLPLDLPPGDLPPGVEPAEMMTVAAARALAEATTVLVGIGQPSAAANLARLVHAPHLVLVYEAGAIGAKPPTLPLSIGDGILADTADEVVSVPELFAYWLQAGRIDVGIVGAAEIDRHGNLNTTVIGEYDQPRVRLPGAGGAAAIMAGCGRTVVMLRHASRAFVDRVGFVTSFGHGDGDGHRERLRLPGGGPALVVTDLGELRPDPDSRELTLTAVHPGVTVDDVRQQTGWDLAVADDIVTSPPPTDEELAVLRELQATVGMRR